MSGADAYELIRACLSHRPEAMRRKTVRSIVDTSVDWDLVQRVAKRHRVLPLLFHALENLMGDRLPSSVREQSRKHRRGVRIQNTFLIQELGRVVHYFENEELPILALKGPVLAQTAYGDIALRHSVDADVLVPKERFSEVDDLLQAIGYEYADKRKAMTGWRKSLSLYLDGQWEFTQGNSFALDVHTRPMPPGYTLSPNFQQFWERARPVRLGKEVVVRGFSAEDQVLILAHHGVKNQWRALRYVADIGGVICSGPDLDWSLLLERVRRMDTTRVLKLGLYMAHDLLDTSIPKDVREWMQEEPVRDLSALAKDYLRNRHRTGVLSYGKRVRLQLATKDTFTARLRYGTYSALQHLWSEFLKPKRNQRNASQ
jgi:hypothetical protein